MEEQISPKDLHYTGTQINYYFVCKRKLWLFCKNIGMEHSSEKVALGKLLTNEHYPRDDKEIEIDNRIKIDFLDVKDKVIHEIKYSPAVEKAHIMQVKYYIYYLKSKGLEGITGEINYPRLRKKERVILSKEDIDSLEDVFRQIKKISDMEIPPETINQKFCRKCSYYELCWS
jgi:CRISPR-associated exonuclease Cas4